MRFKHILFLTVFLIFPQVKAGLIENVSFLKGCWGIYDELGSKVTEQWLPNSTNTMLGIAQKTNTSGQTVSYEFMSITWDKILKTLIFSPIFNGQPLAQFAYDKNISHQNMAVFTNPQNDFPNKIIYSTSQSTALDIKLEGFDNGEPVEFEYSLNKENCLQ